MLELMEKEVTKATMDVMDKMDVMDSLAHQEVKEIEDPWEFKGLKESQEQQD